MRIRASTTALLLLFAGIIGAVQSYRIDHNGILHSVVGLLIIALAVFVVTRAFRRRPT